MPHSTPLIVMSHSQLSLEKEPARAETLKRTLTSSTKQVIKFLRTLYLSRIRRLTSSRLHLVPFPQGPILPHRKGAPAIRRRHCSQTGESSRHIMQDHHQAEVDFGADVEQRGSVLTSVSLSVFNAPTATYMWPALQPLSQMNGPPSLFVSRPPTIRANSYPRADMRHHDIEAARPSSLSPLRMRTISPKCHSHQSEERSRNRQRNDTVMSPPNNQQSRASFSPTNSYSNAQDYPDGLRREYQRSGGATQSDGELYTHRDSQPSSGQQGWEAHAQAMRKPDGRLIYRCTWTRLENGSSVACGYTSKKQLVKRHVETTHLKIKLYVCEYCGKAFPQKTSLDTHKHGHTGSKPHKCKFDCDITFKDPARRHRHMVDAHGYVPKHSKKKQKVDLAVEEPSEYESLQPWNLRTAASVASSSKHTLDSQR